MTDSHAAPAASRAIHLQTEVPGTPEEVWESIATGPGISTWFVPAEVEGRLGGEIGLEFGPGLRERGTITAWEPPHRFAYQDEGERHLAYEFLIEARSGGVCVVRLVNSGFGPGAEWDHEIESMTGGWKLFLHMLTLSRTHFPGQPCASAIINAFAAQPPAAVWETLTGSLGLPSAEPGERLAVQAASLPALGGTVVRKVDGMLTLLLDRPTTGAAFLIAEPWQDQTVAGLYLYLFGPEAQACLSRDEPRWRDWLATTLPSPSA